MYMLDVALALAGVTAVVLGLISNAIRPTPIQEPLAAFAVGIVVGPAVLGILDLAEHSYRLEILKEAARLTRALSLMGIALRTKRRDIIELWRPLLLVLVFGMLGMWVASTLVVALTLGMPLLLALALGAAVAPTDPVVASSIAIGRFAERLLPDRLRETLALEAGANDGLAYLILMLPMLQIEHEAGQALSRWLLGGLVLGVAVAILVGASVGYIAGKMFHRAQETGVMEQYSLLTFSLALSLMKLGTVSAIGSEGILGSFAWPSPEVRSAAKVSD